MFCEKFDADQRRSNPTFRHRNAARAVMQTDYAGPTVEVIDPQTGEVRAAQIFVAALATSSLTFAMASFGQRLPDWIEGQTRALAYFGGVPKAIVCDNLKAAAKLRFVDACIEDIDFASRRGLDRRNTLQLAQGVWLKAHENFIITGLTGTGKTWLACAFGRQAARLDHSVLYLRMPRLFEDIAMARLDGRKR